MKSFNEIIQDAATSMSKYIQYKIEDYRIEGIQADWMQEKAWFLIYEIGTNKLLENINFPEDKIPNYIIREDGKNNV